MAGTRRCGRAGRRMGGRSRVRRPGCPDRAGLRRPVGRLAAVRRLPADRGAGGRPGGRTRGAPAALVGRGARAGSAGLRVHLAGGGAAPGRQHQLSLARGRRLAGQRRSADRRVHPAGTAPPAAQLAHPRHRRRARRGDGGSPLGRPALRHADPADPGRDAGRRRGHQPRLPADRRRPADPHRGPAHGVAVAAAGGSRPDERRHRRDRRRRLRVPLPDLGGHLPPRFGPHPAVAGRHGSGGAGGLGARARRPHAAA